MVIRKRMRAILFPLILYAASAALSSYFLWHALNGERGLKTRDEYARQIALLEGQLTALKEEHEQWQHRIGLMHNNAVDRDLLDEATRTRLGRIGADDLMVILPTTP
ncbi:FtsB family cell division protein [Beijerinckia indica]|uniref:Septum formation initiator n=1 Tax=Beijerinckia indica subsp. indica (strain ATCC 9039 / DSM 1715 / NCIMB 8712) TaxID=395963 RepID=B2IB53_BEII9|nr:septum formation initiator family protein [Beijerinckia indica]ACB95137.1 Septum formation initiator [Beijerinckia indica subsp. indica ATCC 9039]